MVSQETRRWHSHGTAARALRVQRRRHVSSWNRYKQAAEKGYAQAQNGLALCYLCALRVHAAVGGTDGCSLRYAFGVAADAEEAVKWLRCATALRCSTGQHVATLYCTGAPWRSTTARLCSRSASATSSARASSSLEPR